MRRIGDLSAVAIVLSIIAAGAVVPPASAASKPSATIVDPPEGARVRDGDRVLVQYEHPPQTFEGEVRLEVFLDGTPAGWQNAWVSASGTARLIETRLNASNATSGAHVLTARVMRVASNESVGSAPRSIVVDLPPQITAATAWYDEDARAIHVGADVSDDFDDPVRIVATYDQGGGGAGSAIMASGPVELVIPIDLQVSGADWEDHVVDLEAFDDARSSTVRVPFVVEDRPTNFEDVTARWEVNESGGSVFASAVIRDPDELPDRLSLFVDGGWAGFMYRVAGDRFEGRAWLEPRLGVMGGEIWAHDLHGGRGWHNFTFTIGGPREVVYERRIDTGIGGHADALTIDLPATLGGTFEVCMRECADPSGAELEIAPGCAGSPPAVCSTLHGDPRAEPLVRPACGRPEPDTGRGATFQDWAFWMAVHAVEDGRVPNGTKGPTRATIPLVGGMDLPTDDAPKLCVDRASRVGASTASLVSAQGRGNSRDNALIAEGLARASDDRFGQRQFIVDCTATNSTVCNFEAPHPWTLDLTWIQAPSETVVVRITGVRV